MVIHLKEYEEAVRKYKLSVSEKIIDGWSKKKGQSHTHEFEVIQVLNGYCPATGKPAMVITKRCTICTYTYDEFTFL